ncbi:hypothetical protein DVH05_020061 [Phytophthora capsici]|nr:hypothetical protein DVH05_020061 [Phytophthora capsici]
MVSPINAGSSDVDMTPIGASTEDEEALALLNSSEHPSRDLLVESSVIPRAQSVATDGTAAFPTNSSNSRPATTATVSQAKASSSSNVSAVYRWYDVEESFGAKKREESSIAKCKLCRQQGKLERKTCVRFSKSVTSNLWRHLKENHPDVYEKHRGEKKSVQMHRVVGVKKRGRKKKIPPPVSAAAPSYVVEQVAKAKSSVEEFDGQSVTAIRPPAKKMKRGELYPSAVSSTLHHQQSPSRQTSPAAVGKSSGGVSGTGLIGNFNLEKVREAMGYLCLYEMLPFDLCSSPAFRSLMMECSKGTGDYVDNSNSFALFSKENASGSARKMAAEVKVRTVMQMKMTDFTHLMVSRWCSMGKRVAAISPYTVPSESNEMCFLALFAVGLDQEFNPFRRCLHVSSIGNHHARVAEELAADKELKKAMNRLVPCRLMPEILAVDPPSTDYQSFCTDHKLQCLESVPTVLHNIMIATINGVQVSGSYSLGSAVSMSVGASGAVGFRSWRLDQGEYIESSSASGSTNDYFYGGAGIPAVEVTSNILEELPTSLTGHTHLDLINKVMYLLAHFKHSSRSRRVLRRLALENCGMGADTYERSFIDRLRVMAISLGNIHSLLSLAGDLMSVLQQYFLLHKEGTSDFSKLIQLSCLSQYEWSRVRYLTVILKPFAEATTKLDGEKYVVSSLIVPSIFTLVEKLREARSANIRLTNNGSRRSGAEVLGSLPEDIEVLRDLAFRNLSTCFGHLFSVPNASWSTTTRQTFNLLWSATILDPRTRSFIVKGALPQDEFWEIVKAEAANIAGTKVKDKDNGNGDNSISLDEDNGHLDGTGVAKSTDLWDDLQANLVSCAQEELLLSSGKPTLEIPKSSNLLEVEVSFFQEEGRIVLRANPLEWWQNMRMKYPFLARLARYVLSIPCNVNVEDNPVQCDGGLVKRGPSQMSTADLCDLLAASMNLRTEKNAHFEAASKHMWSTV